MTITVLKDDGTEQIFQHVSDAYLAVRQNQPVGNKDGELATLPETRSFSWGGNIRELVKEIRQSIFELQEYIKCPLPQA